MYAAKAIKAASTSIAKAIKAASTSIAAYIYLIFQTVSTKIRLACFRKKSAFLLLPEPLGHIPQGFLYGTRFVRKHSGCFLMAEVSV